MDANKKYQDDNEKLDEIEKLRKIKESVEESHDYFNSNVERYHHFRNFVFNTSISEDDRAKLNDRQMPDIEFNILEAYISRLRGEFAKQQPSLNVRAADGVPDSMIDNNFTQTISVIEAHMRCVLNDATNDALEYDVYTDQLSGGFSVLEVYTDYVNEMSFEQNIDFSRAFDPALTYFDPLARKSHKGDGQYCGKLFPMRKKEFRHKWPKVDVDGMRYSKDIGGFGWSYKDESEDIILVAEHYEKRQKKATIYKLSNGHTVTKKEYDAYMKEYNENFDINKFGMEQPPAIVNERKTTITEIVQYIICETEILDSKTTNFKHLPLVFVDGNSINLTENGSSYQMCRPYVYHAEGIQRLKNFAGQSLANEIENTVQHKWIVPIESIPEEYQEAYQNVQKADVLAYNHFADENQDAQLPPPREVQRTPIPPEITRAFSLTDGMTQAILGSYDSSLGINDNQLSGAAIAKGAMQSNNASMPYIVSFTKALNRVAEIILNLIPKYYRTPRSLPILLPNNKREYYMINRPGNLYLNYDDNMLQVKVEAGVNFAMQKDIAMQTIQQLMQASSTFAEFINSKGLPVLLENLEIRGAEELKLKAEEFMQEREQQQQQAQQMQQQQMQQQEQIQEQQTQMEMQSAQMTLAKQQKDLQQPSKKEIDLMKLQEESQKNAAEISIKERESETDFIETLSKIRNESIDNELEAERIEAENMRTRVQALDTLTDEITAPGSTDDNEEGE